MNKGVDLLYLVSIISLVKIAQGNFHFPIVNGSHTVNDGESLTLNCRFGDQTATLSWKKDDGVLPQGVIVPSPENLTISSVDYMYHVGAYQCVATFPNGSSIVSQPFSVTVQYIDGELTICEVTSNGEIVNGEIVNGIQSKWLQYRLIQNSNITLKCCRPSAVPNLTVMWFLNEKIPTGDSITYKEDNTILEINNIVNTQHAGFYECIGSHPTLGETTQLSEIEVLIRDKESTQPPPNELINVNIPSSLVCVELGGDVTIPCIVTGPDKTDVKWSIGNTPVVVGDRYSVNDDNSLTIMNVRESDARNLKCQASLSHDDDNIIDTASDTVELDTRCIESASIQTSTPTVGIGTSLELSCIISPSLSNVSEITWTSPSGSMTTGDKLKIQNISYSHAGEYTCTADHPNSEPKSDSIIIIVEGPPTVSVILDPFEVLLNHTLSITCITNATHNPSLIWSKGEEEVVSRDGMLVSVAGNSSTVNINRAREEDATSYSCKLNDAIHNPVSKTIQVNLSTSIYLSRPLPDQSGITNCNFSVACPVMGGTRNLSVIWYKEATAVVSGVDGMVIRTNTEGFSELYVSSLNISHEGLYMCKATDNISEFNTSFYVTVYIPGRFVTDLPENRMMTVNEGDSVVIDCKVDGKPLPEVHWHDVEIGGRITADFNGSVLTISDIREEDESSYVCHFYRIGDGTRSRGVKLYVVVKQANENTTENNNDGNDNNDTTILGLHRSVFISVILAGVGALFLLFTIILCCGLLCYFKFCRDRQNTEIPKVINLETTSFERKPSIRGSFRNKDNSGILQQSPSNISSLWTFASDGQSNSIPITIASSVAVSPGPPLPSLGPTTSMVTEDEFRLPNGVTNFARQNLKLDNVMGEGEFGPVFRGVARHIRRDEEQSIVAVKVLMPREGEDHLWPSLIDFANQMKLSSPFIASILGICADTEPYYVIYDYLDRGDLKQFLMNSRPNRNLQPSLTQSQLLHIATQVSQGMSYLYKQQIIHGDLATRNCLISSNLTVKIADLGIGHDLYGEDYYDNGTQLLPIRWMAPELFVNSEEGPAFSLASDVWSFGVFCWEVFAYARQPYDELSDTQVLRLIPAGHVLSAPEEGCPPLLFSLMQDCLAANMDQRPIFTEITTVILSIDVD